MLHVILREVGGTQNVKQYTEPYTKAKNDAKLYDFAIIASNRIQRLRMMLNCMISQ